MKHDIDTHLFTTGWGWSCKCGRESGSNMQRSEGAARAAGLRHIRNAEDADRPDGSGR